MIKGVNKKIIEINNPQSIYFEKAVFYLKPNVSKLPDNIANCEIERYINMINLENGYTENPWKKILRRIIIGCVAVTGLITTILAIF